jgi:hypothetical protein
MIPARAVLEAGGMGEDLGGHESRVMSRESRAGFTASASILDFFLQLRPAFRHPGPMPVIGPPQAHHDYSQRHGNSRSTKQPRRMTKECPR